MPSYLSKLWLLVILALTAGCALRNGRHETKQRELMHTSFENLVGWLPPASANLSTEKAHTGRFALRVDPEHPYSLTYRSTLGKLCSHRPRRFTLNAWVWVPSFKDDAVLVTSISNPADPSHPIFLNFLYLTTSGKYEQWKPVSQDMDLPANISSNNELVVYLWNANAMTPVYADDLQLTELW